VVPAVLVPVREHLELARVDVAADDPPSAARAVLGPLAGDEPAFEVEGVAVRAPARRAEDGDARLRRPPPELVRLGGREVDAPVGPLRRPPKADDAPVGQERSSTNGGEARWVHECQVLTVNRKSTPP